MSASIHAAEAAVPVKQLLGRYRSSMLSKLAFERCQTTTALQIKDLQLGLVEELTAADLSVVRLELFGCDVGVCNII